MAQQIKIRYAETSSLFSSQFLVNATAEDVTVGFSSGYMQDPGSGETTLPIHSKIAMTLEGAQRLHSILGKIIEDKVNKKPDLDNSLTKTPNTSLN